MGGFLVSTEVPGIGFLACCVFGASISAFIAALGSCIMSTWGRVLKIIKCPGEADRLEAIAEILNCSGLASILDLRSASDPVAWKRFSDLLPAEVAFFRSLATAAKPAVPAAAQRPVFAACW